MTCRCGSKEEHARRAVEAQMRSMPPTPNKRQYEILDIEEVGPHLVVRVKYPNCARCAYEGTKVMVFFDVKIKDALFWKEIDPHFREPAGPRRSLAPLKEQAPPPMARFPASDEGWKDAMEYARRKATPHTPGEGGHYDK